MDGSDKLLKILFPDDDFQTELDSRMKKRGPAIAWLAKQMKSSPNDLGELLRTIRKRSPSYKVIYLPKGDGSKRKVCIPNPKLKKIQRRVNRYVLNSLPVSPNAFGFSGGSILDAIKPHLGAKTILSLDIQDAFPNVDYVSVLFFLKERFSWAAARIIAELTTFQDELPQGAPTSPKLFDLICYTMDKMLSELAEETGGNYTRYADNIFFSTNEVEFPRKVKRAILHIIGTESSVESGGHFQKLTIEWGWHNLRTRKIDDKSALRMLGLNVIEGKIHNTRAFKRRLRLSIHHVGWLLEHGMRDTPEFEKAWRNLQGQMQFARIDTLPQKLLDAYLELEEQIM